MTGECRVKQPEKNSVIRLNPRKDSGTFILYRSGRRDHVTWRRGAIKFCWNCYLGTRVYNECLEGPHRVSWVGVQIIRTALSSQSLFTEINIGTMSVEKISTQDKIVAVRVNNVSVPIIIAPRPSAEGRRG